jgi:hypothetical protein
MDTGDLVSRLARPLRVVGEPQEVADGLD